MTIQAFNEKCEKLAKIEARWDSLHEIDPESVQFLLECANFMLANCEVDRKD